MGRNDLFTGKWLSNTKNEYSNFVTDVTAKGAKGDLPTLTTGKKTGPEILETKVTKLLSSADPFGDAAIAWNAVTSNPSNYYIVNYWSADHYNLGHIPGAVQYTPKVDLKLATNLKTLPTNKEIVVYCYTGQTSAHVAAFLRLLGYNAKSLKFGVNIMNYDWAINNGLTHFDASCVMGYDYVTGP